MPGAFTLAATDIDFLPRSASGLCLCLRKRLRIGTLGNLCWTAGCSGKHVTPWITVEPGFFFFKGNLRIAYSSSWLWVMATLDWLGSSMTVCIIWTTVQLFACVQKMTLCSCGCDFVYYICIQMCAHAAFGWLLPTHHTPSHFTLILQGLDKSKEQTSGGLRREPSEPHRLVGPQCQGDVTTPACGPGFSCLMWTRARTSQLTINTISLAWLPEVLLVTCFLLDRVTWISVGHILFQCKK